MRSREQAGERDGGLRRDSVLKGFDERKQTHASGKDIDLPALRIANSHTGEEVLAAAIGPGAECVRGFFPNTHRFDVMMQAWGWKR